MKKFTVVGLLLLLATTLSCKSYCGRSCVNRYSSVTPKEDTNLNSDVSLLEETSEFN